VFNSRTGELCVTAKGPSPDPLVEELAKLARERGLTPKLQTVCSSPAPKKSSNPFAPGGKYYEPDFSDVSGGRVKPR
jgi:hypothetical protein